LQKPNALTNLRYQVLGLFCSACIYSTCLYILTHFIIHASTVDYITLTYDKLLFC